MSIPGLSNGRKERVMILVLGATGTNGREVLQRLAASGVPARALVRDPARARAQGLDAPGVELVPGDFDDRDALNAAFRGVEKAFVLTPVDRLEVDWVRSATGAAKAAGTRHLVRFSAMGADPASPSELARHHGESDEVLKSSGLAWTILQPNSFHQNILWSAGSVKAAGAIYAPMKDARQSFVDVRDIADVAVLALTRTGHEGQVYELTGPESLSYADLARILTEVLGKPVQYVDVPPEAAEAAMRQAGMPEWNAHAVTELFGRFATGAFAKTTDTVARLLGRPPIPFAQFAREHAGSFR
jgi:uncharacterized protein YbjT (DUF2867 family)